MCSVACEHEASLEPVRELEVGGQDLSKRAWVLGLCRFSAQSCSDEELTLTDLMKINLSWWEVGAHFCQSLVACHITFKYLDI